MKRAAEGAITVLHPVGDLHVRDGTECLGDAANRLCAVCRNTPNTLQAQVDELRAIQRDTG